MSELGDALRAMADTFERRWSKRGLALDLRARAVEADALADERDTWESRFLDAKCSIVSARQDRLDAWTRADQAEARVERVRAALEGASHTPFSKTLPPEARGDYWKRRAEKAETQVERVQALINRADKEFHFATVGIDGTGYSGTVVRVNDLRTALGHPPCTARNCDGIPCVRDQHDTTWHRDAVGRQWNYDTTTPCACCRCLGTADEHTVKDLPGLFFPHFIEHRHGCDGRHQKRDRCNTNAHTHGAPTSDDTHEAGA
ncbi:hypothetical protein DNL40_02460 [Xylanimonas oleitrophica]|uniref:Uncharacterized protein n=1 Tax=Xylanimonas oleitrophica TaxID=2607479 RepID=A0A2W5WX56_9MICO|nr:hypothetical protein [Xylanimonas oleitrophica]PZR55253.1 hypothetical protein DNL40_02460 [Xylanimonas oleitrophica]